jgi:uncharacterized protein YebE (UPF0316 family)
MLNILVSPSAWLAGLTIFALRVCDMSMDTMRMLFVMRGRKPFAWLLGFGQSLIFVIAITSVLRHANNPLTVVGYAAGFATGNVVGMWIEGRLAIGHIHLSIVSPRRGAEMAQSLRRAGFAVTEISARGKDGMVSMLSVSVQRRDVSRVQAFVHQADAEAFVIAEDVRPLRRGFWRA